jgi:hypothetical protein
MKGAMTALLLIVLTIHLSSAISATGTITGRIVSTSINVQNISFNELESNSAVYYYKTSGGVGSVSLNTQASGIVPFATIDFALDSGSVVVSIGDNKTLPSGAKIILDDDPVPSSTSSDPNQVQITGNSQNQAAITYPSQNAEITYNDDGNLYVFIRTGTAIGDINVDILLSS